MKRPLIIVAALSLAGLLAYHLFFTAGKNTTTNNVGRIIKLTQDTSSQYKDAAGNSHTVVKFVTDPNRELVIAVLKQQIDSVTKLYKISQEELYAFGQASSKSELNVETKVVYRDTSRRAVDFSWSDRYTKVNGNVLLLPNPVGFLHYSSVDSLSYVFHEKHRNVLQKLTQSPVLLMDISAQNPHTTFTNSSGVYLPKAKDFPIKFGAYVGYGATLSGDKVYRGVQAGAGLVLKF